MWTYSSVMEKVSAGHALMHIEDSAKPAHAAHCEEHGPHDGGLGEVAGVVHDAQPVHVATTVATVLYVRETWRASNPLK
jgi:hypothetical protein